MQKGRLLIRFLLLATLKILEEDKLCPARQKLREEELKIEVDHWKSYGRRLGIGGIFESHDLFPLTSPLQDVFFFQNAYTNIFLFILQVFPHAL